MPKPAPRVLLVERSADAPALDAALTEAGFHVLRPGSRGAGDGHREPLDAMLVAFGRETSEAGEIVTRERDRDPGLRLVAIVGREDGAAALAAIRARASFVHERPVDPGAVVESVRAALGERATRRRIEELEANAEARTQLLARSPAMRRLIEQIERIAPTRATVLLEGEPGTGKRRIARALHALSPRKSARFVALDGAAPTLEADLFGAAGSGAPGALELAEGGTLYLEHIGDTPPSVQVQLLRILLDRVWERPGGGEVRADVRIMVSSDRDLMADVAAGRLRRDLYDRLSVATLVVPPLRERREDIPGLIREMLRRPSRDRRRSRSGLTPGALERLMAHAWPGNVRELEHVVGAMAAIAADGRTLGIDDLPPALRPEHAAGVTLAAGMTVAEAERALIAATLRHTGGDKARAAALLGIGLRTLYRKLGGPAR